MFDFLKGGKVNLNLTLDRPTGIYFPGDEIRATLELTSDKELKIQQGRLVLACEESHQVCSLTTSTDSDGNSSQEESYTWTTSSSEVARQVFLGEGTLPAGTSQRYEFSARIPDEALPTLSGQIVTVKWMLKATLDRKLAADVNAEARILVHNLPSGAPTAGQYGQSSDPSNVEMILELPAREWSAGELLSGRLLLQPHKNFDVSEIRLELECCEEVPVDHGNQKRMAINIQVAGKTRLQEGQALRFPFQLVLPEGCTPTLYTDRWSLSWKLQGVLARFLRPDIVVAEELVVCSGRAG